MGFALGGLATIVPRRIDGVTLRATGGPKSYPVHSSALSPNYLLKISEYRMNDGQHAQSSRSSVFQLKTPRLCWKVSSVMGSTRGLDSYTYAPRARSKRRDCKISVRNHQEPDDPQGDFSYRRSSAPNRDRCSHEPIDQSGYEIKVSKEMMGVFQYVEKVKRVRLRELSATLRQVAGACLAFSFIKGFVTPLVEVFKTDPPNWGKLIMFVGAFDAFALSYLALKAREPLDKLSALATEFSSEDQMMGSIEKEEELMLAFAMELLGLFGRLRYLTLVTAVAQLAHIVHALLQVRGIQTNLPEYFANFVASWLGTPWA